MEANKNNKTNSFLSSFHLETKNYLQRNKKKGKNHRVSFLFFAQLENLRMRLGRKNSNLSHITGRIFDFQT